MSHAQTTRVQKHIGDPVGKGAPLPAYSDAFRFVAGQPLLLQHGMHFSPFAVKLIRHFVSSCLTNRL